MKRNGAMMKQQSDLALQMKEWTVNNFLTVAEDPILSDALQNSQILREREKSRTV